MPVKNMLQSEAFWLVLGAIVGVLGAQMLAAHKHRKKDAAHRAALQEEQARARRGRWRLEARGGRLLAQPPVVPDAASSVVDKHRPRLGFDLRLPPFLPPLKPRVTRWSTDHCAVQVGHNEQRKKKRLAQLNLTGCGDSPIGNQFNRGISGGEKRRVSVAVELLSEPAILYLDEPTTGLDSTTAVNLTAILRDIARDGTTVIMSIHQPRLEIFEMITQVIMLTKDGRVGYCGPTLLLHDYSRQEIATIRKVTSADETEAFVDYESGVLENAKNP